jgi:hypothetical protein
MQQRVFFKKLAVEILHGQFFVASIYEKPGEIDLSLAKYIQPRIQLLDDGLRPGN